MIDEKDAEANIILGDMVRSAVLLMTHCGYCWEKDILPDLERWVEATINGQMHGQKEGAEK
jgi:hypothetical protein